MSLSNFAEIIMAPSEPGIVTAAGNWQARLAAASIGINKGPFGCAQAPRLLLVVFVAGYDKWSDFYFFHSRGSQGEVCLDFVGISIISM